MLDTNVLISFFVAVLILLVSPGPTSTLMLSTGFSYGFWPALFTGLGISSAVLVSSSLTVFGLSSFLAHAPTTLTALRILGIGYLLYLAFKEVCSKPTNTAMQSSAKPYVWPHRFWQNCFCRGFLVDTLNPSNLVFLVVFLPQFVNERLGNFRVQLIVLALLYTAIDFAFNSLLAYVGSRAGQHFSRQSFCSSRQALHLGRYFLAGVYVVLALCFLKQAF
jgi:threonine/homoserine/homoserine lactone efflux protein